MQEENSVRDSGLNIRIDVTRHANTKVLQFIAICVKVIDISTVILAGMFI